MSIAKIADTGDEILLSCSLKTESGGTVASSIGVNGSIVGTASVDSSAGLNPNSAGSVQFVDIDPDGDLKYEGQIVLTVTNPNTIAEYDDSSFVSGSEGINRIVNGYLISILDSLSANHGRQWFSIDDALRGAIHVIDAEVNIPFHSTGKKTVEFCMWWFGDSWGIFLNGVSFFNGARTDRDAFDPHTLNIGATFNGTDETLEGSLIIDLVVSRNSPRLQINPNVLSVTIAGDSYAAASFVAIQTPKYDVAVKYGIQAGLVNRGFALPRFVEDAHSGFTMCDIASGNQLSDFFADITSIENAANVVLYFASNNDIDGATELERNDGSTGTVANYRTLLTALFNTNRTKLVILTTAGSLKGQASLDTPELNAVLAEVVDMVEGLVSWADENLAVGFV